MFRAIDFHSFLLCTISFTIALASLFLLPGTIVSIEILLLYPHNYYLQWLNEDFIFGTTFMDVYDVYSSVEQHFCRSKCFPGFHSSICLFLLRISRQEYLDTVLRVTHHVTPSQHHIYSIHLFGTQCLHVVTDNSFRCSFR